MVIEEIENQIEAEFQNFSDWMDKYNHLIEMGKTLPLIDEKLKVDNNLISGCQSRVWLAATFEKGRVHFSADSDAMITKGIISMLIRVLSGQTPDTIINASLDFIDRIDLKEHLSPTRSNGMDAMVRQMKLYAIVFKAKELQVP
jgi:cysteine desulfuration protein SufE